MRFTKMQGAGNDYIYINCFAEKPPRDPAALSRAMSDRHFGIGGDGVILICPSERADARMRMFNADGSEAEMCGNGIRCVAKYVYDHGITRKSPLKIETGNGILTLELRVEQGKVDQVCVDMGAPILQADKIPTTLAGNPPVNVPLPGYDYKVTCVSMGNPHAIIYVDEITDHKVLTEGPLIERSEMFPRRTNVEFVKVNNRKDVTFRVWERGSGETMACGTGACAVCVAGVLTGRSEREIVAHLPGGDLLLQWNEDDNHVYMTGPATEVFSGEWSEG